MELIVEDDFEVKKKLDSFISNTTSLCILPENILKTDEIDKYYYSSTLPTVIKLFESNKVPITIYGKSDELKFINQRGLEIFAPILFVGSLFYTQNSEVVSLALGIIANYLTDIFKGKKNSQVNLKIYLRDDKKKILKKVKYKGPPESLKEVDKIIMTTMKSFSEDELWKK